MTARPRELSAAFVASLVPHALLLAWLSSIVVHSPSRTPRITVSLVAARGNGGSSGGGGFTPAQSGAHSSQTLAMQTLIPPQVLEPDSAPARDTPEAARETPRPQRDVPAPAPKHVPAAAPIAKDRPTRSAEKHEPAPMSGASAAKARKDRVSEQASPLLGLSADNGPAGGTAGKELGRGQAGSCEGNAGTRNGRDGAGDAGDAGNAHSAYRARLVQLLARHKKYPPRALAMGLESEIVLRVAIDSDGRVQSKSIDDEDRESLFHRAVEEMIERASPFPPLPSELGREVVEFVVPVSFRIEAG